MIGGNNTKNKNSPIDDQVRLDGVLTFKDRSINSQPVSCNCSTTCTNELTFDLTARHLEKIKLKPEFFFLQIALSSIAIDQVTVGPKMRRWFEE